MVLKRGYVNAIEKGPVIDEATQTYVENLSQEGVTQNGWEEGLKRKPVSWWKA